MLIQLLPRKLRTPMNAHHPTDETLNGTNFILPERTASSGAAMVPTCSTPEEHQLEISDTDTSKLAEAASYQYGHALFQRLFPRTPVNNAGNNIEQAGHPLAVAEGGSDVMDAKLAELELRIAQLQHTKYSVKDFFRDINQAFARRKRETVALSLLPTEVALLSPGQQTRVNHSSNLKHSRLLARTRPMRPSAHAHAALLKRVGQFPLTLITILTILLAFFAVVPQVEAQYSPNRPPTASPMVADASIFTVSPTIFVWGDSAEWEEAAAFDASEGQELCFLDTDSGKDSETPSTLFVARTTTSIISTTISTWDNSEEPLFLSSAPAVRQSGTEQLMTITALGTPDSRVRVTPSSSFFLSEERISAGDLLQAAQPGSRLLSHLRLKRIVVPLNGEAPVDLVRPAVGGLKLLNLDDVALCRLPLSQGLHQEYDPPPFARVGLIESAITPHHDIKPENVLLVRSLILLGEGFNRAVLLPIETSLSNRTQSPGLVASGSNSNVQQIIGSMAQAWQSTFQRIQNNNAVEIGLAVWLIVVLLYYRLIASGYTALACARFSWNIFPRNGIGMLFSHRIKQDASKRTFDAHQTDKGSRDTPYLGGDGNGGGSNDPPWLKIEEFDKDGMTTIDGYVIVENNRVFLTFRSGLNPEDRERGKQILLKYARENSDAGVRLWNVTDAESDTDSDAQPDEHGNANPEADSNDTQADEHTGTDADAGADGHATTDAHTGTNAYGASDQHARADSGTGNGTGNGIQRPRLTRLS